MMATPFHQSEESVFYCDPQTKCRYRLVDLLGTGAFGEVWQATDEQNQVFAAKVVLLSVRDRSKTLKREVENCRRAPQILGDLTPKLIASFDDRPRNVFIQICELFQFDLGFLSGREALSEPLVRLVMRDMSKALSLLHNARPEPMYHRDIKPANILVDTAGRVVLCDFGMARGPVPPPAPGLEGSKGGGKGASRAAARAMRASINCGTRGYMAPEAMNDEDRDMGSGDVWSLGITMVQLAVQMDPVEAHEEARSESRNSLPLPNGFSPKSRDFLTCTLKPVAIFRSTSEELATHDWFSACSEGDKAALGQFVVRHSQAVAQERALLKQQEEEEEKPWGWSQLGSGSQPSVILEGSADWEEQEKEAEEQEEEAKEQEEEEEAAPPAAAGDRAATTDLCGREMPTLMMEEVAENQGAQAGSPTKKTQMGKLMSRIANIKLPTAKLPSTRLPALPFTAKKPQRQGSTLEGALHATPRAVWAADPEAPTTGSGGAEDEAATPSEAPGASGSSGAAEEDAEAKRSTAPKAIPADAEKPASEEAPTTKPAAEGAPTTTPMEPVSVEAEKATPAEATRTSSVEPAAGTGTQDPRDEAKHKVTFRAPEDEPPTEVFREATTTSVVTHRPEPQADSIETQATAAGTAAGRQATAAGTAAGRQATAAETHFIGSPEYAAAALAQEARDARENRQRSPGGTLVVGGLQEPSALSGLEIPTPLAALEGSHKPMQPKERQSRKPAPFREALTSLGDAQLVIPPATQADGGVQSQCSCGWFFGGEEQEEEEEEEIFDV